MRYLFETSRLWREVCERVMKAEFPEVSWNMAIAAGARTPDITCHQAS
jgi:hypothetical protein